MKDVNALRQKRGQLIEACRKILDKAEAEKRKLTAEEDQEYARMDGEQEEIRKDVEREERQQKLEAEMARSQRDDARPLGDNDDDKPKPLSAAELEEKRHLAIQGWLGFDKAKFTIEERHVAAGKIFGLPIAQKEISFCIRTTAEYTPRQMQVRAMFANKSELEARALSVVTGSAGAYTVPQGFIPILEDAMLFVGGVRPAATVFRTDTGNPLPYPTDNDTANEGELLAENSSIGSSVDPTFGQIVFNAYKYSSKLILVPFELLQDSAFDLPSFIARKLGERIGRKQATDFTTGDGSSKPNGIVTASTAGKTAASATAIISDELIDLEHSVDPSYRPGAGWMFHDNILAAIRKLKESTTNAYIWQPGLQTGIPERILSYPFFINQKMASSIAASAKTILFGRLDKYNIRDVAEVRLVRMNERYADTDQVGFVAFLRSDGDLVDAGTNPIKHLVQAAA